MVANIQPDGQVVTEGALALSTLQESVDPREVYVQLTDSHVWQFALCGGYRTPPGGRP